MRAGLCACWLLLCVADKLLALAFQRSFPAELPEEEKEDDEEKEKSKAVPKQSRFMKAGAWPAGVCMHAWLDSGM